MGDTLWTISFTSTDSTFTRETYFHYSKTTEVKKMPLVMYEGKIIYRPSLLCDTTLSDQNTVHTYICDSVGRLIFRRKEYLNETESTSIKNYDYSYPSSTVIEEIYSTGNKKIPYSKKAYQFNRIGMLISISHYAFYSDNSSTPETIHYYTYIK